MRGGYIRPCNSGEKGGGKGGKGVVRRVRGGGEFFNRAVHREAGGERSMEVERY